MAGASKYDSLWKWMSENCGDSLTLPFGEIEEISGVPVDHSFLRYKKELEQYGFCVHKISLKERTVDFRRLRSKGK